MEDSYDDFPRVEEAFGALLDESLDPRGPSSLWELVDGLGIAAGSVVVDVGCGEGDDALTLISGLASTSLESTRCNGTSTLDRRPRARQALVIV